MPGFNFSFDFPEFKQLSEIIISRNIEAWGCELLVEFRENQNNYAKYIVEQEVSDIVPTPQKSTLVGDYQIIRRDEKVISVLYTIDRYYSGAAHGGRTTRVQNFCINPFAPLTLDYLLGGGERLPELADLLREKLASTNNYDAEWLASGTEPTFDNFSRFNIDNHGLVFTFSEYQIDCFAAGEQKLWVGFNELESICDRDVLMNIKANMI
ncbi:RsiV family protein [Aeromonas hydrophila]|uniref:RsiV family protein n=1 Tax=Aeromonas hydrophila TaxID=644 RepID=UPI0039861F8C